MSLLEVMVSQTIGLIVISAIMALVVAMVRKLSSETAVSDAQVRLRQVTHLILRDTQGVGGDISSSGDVVFVRDGGANGPDELTLFKRDESVCGGAVPIKADNTHDGGNLNISDIDIDLTAGTDMQCPIGQPTCPEAELTGRAVLVVGQTRSMQMTGHNARAASCKINYPIGQQADDISDAYDARYGTATNNIKDVLDDLKPVSILVGSSFVYRVRNNTLERSTDGGTTFVSVLENVVDMQIERVYFDDDTDTNPGLAADPVFVAGTTGSPLPANITEDEFLGLRIGFVTFAPARNDLVVPPPATFSNRDLTSLPGDRRYRASFIFAASRNRTGA